MWVVSLQNLRYTVNKFNDILTTNRRSDVGDLSLSTNVVVHDIGLSMLLLILYLQHDGCQKKSLSLGLSCISFH
jgi:hypothetical protein